MSADIAMDKSATATATANAPVPVTAAANRDSRIHTHSHIKGLGLAQDGTALPISQGFVGQTQAREALGIHLGLLKEGRYSGRPLLLVGPPGTGKVSARANERAERASEPERGVAARSDETTSDGIQKPSHHHQTPSVSPSEARVPLESSSRSERDESGARRRPQGDAERRG